MKNTVKKSVTFFILKNVQILEKLTYLRFTSSNGSQILLCGWPMVSFVFSSLKNLLGTLFEDYT